MWWRFASMRKKMGVSTTLICLLFAICSIHSCDGARRTAQRRKDPVPNPENSPVPSAESLQAIAQVMGAAGFEAYTEGKALVKRLIPANSQPDLDLVEHQGVIGRAGVDFPAFPSIPTTGFNCKNVPTGYYADLETDCQVFHICDTSRKISFLCPNGTIFSQSHLICDWWFKVDCASAPALYESSAEYYSNEQKKSQRTHQNPTKNHDLQQVEDANDKKESKYTPSTTEKLLRQQQRLQSEGTTNKINSKGIKSYQTLFPEINTDPTQKTQATTLFEKRRKNLVQLIANNFGNLPKRTTVPAFEYSTRRSATAGESNSLREMQVAAETASFAHNQNRQFLQDYSKTYRPYPVYTPNLATGPDKNKINPTLTTLYDFRDKYLPQRTDEITTKRATLVPYTKSYSDAIEKQEPYTRPGILSLKEFLDKQKNKGGSITTEIPKIVETTTKTNKLNSDNEKKLTIETKSSFESVTMLPDVTQDGNDYFDTSSSDRVNLQTTKNIKDTTEPTYQERRERLLSKINLEAFGPTEPTYTASLTEKYYGNVPNRPGLLVPPSLTPKTLHSLAIYYATGLDNFATTAVPEEVESTTISDDEYEAMEDKLPALFSQQTVNKYSNLFGHDNNNADLLENIKLDPNSTYNEIAEDLSMQMSQNPLATSPQIRELAQVFTHALSAYLQDPVQFRKVLSDIRPTPPSFSDMLTTDELLFNTEPTTTVNEDDQEILGFSDDHKIRVPIASIREGKSLKGNTETKTFNDITTTGLPPTTEIVTTPSTTTTPRSPFRCCGRISASYTTAATPKETASTSYPFTNSGVQVSALQNKFTENFVATTEDSFGLQKYGGFQNNKYIANSSHYGLETNSDKYKEQNDYTEITNLPSAWGIDATLTPVTNGNIFESKRIKSTIPVTTPKYFTETESIELENEEELQRAHSQSFVAPQGNSVRQGKNIHLDNSKNTFKKPSENLEAPTTPTFDTTTAPTSTDVPTTTIKEETESLPTTSAISENIFTSPDSERTTYQLPTTFENWQSTIIIDPITLNDGLSSTGADQSDIDLVEQSNSWALTTSTIPPTTEYIETSEQSVSSTLAIELATLSGRTQERYGRLLKESTTEPPQELTTIAETVVEKAKEIMGGMNSTTTEKLMNVMMKTKSKTVKRLILLLIQTCDDDHNSTAEASKKALLEALMAVSQKDMEDVAKEQAATQYPSTTSGYDYFKTTLFTRRMDSQPTGFESPRRGKSLTYDASAINSLSHTATTQSVKTEQTEEPTTLSPTTTENPIKTVSTTYIDNNKFQVVNWPVAQARVAPQNTNLKSPDTRALELLRSLYTIAARWG